MENILIDRFQPLLSNWFSFKTFGFEIPSNNFKSYKLYNNGEDFFLEVEIYETVNFIFDPNDIFLMTEIDLEYVNTSGSPISTMKFEVKGINFEKVGDYEKNDLSIVNLTMKVKKR